MANDGTVSKITPYGNVDGYTPVKVKDKDSGKSFVINFKNARITGNESSWTIKDGKVYDKDGKTIEDNTLEVTRYQAALIEAAAGNDYRGDKNYLDEEDLNGAGYADTAKEALQKAKSEYKLDQWTAGYVPGQEGHPVPDIVPAADATEGGVIIADVINDKGDKGQLTIDIRTDEQLAEEQRLKEEAQKYFEKANKPWWKFW